MTNFIAIPFESKHMQLIKNLKLSNRLETQSATLLENATKWEQKKSFKGMQDRKKEMYDRWNSWFNERETADNIQKWLIKKQEMCSSERGMA